MPCKLSPVSTWHITNIRNNTLQKILTIDIYTPVSTIVILQVNLAPLTVFHALKRRDISRVSIPSGPLRPRSTPDFSFISKHPIPLSRTINFGDLFPFLFLVNAHLSSRTCIGTYWNLDWAIHIQYLLIPKLAKSPLLICVIFSAPSKMLS